MLKIIMLATLALIVAISAGAIELQAMDGWYASHYSPWTLTPQFIAGRAIEMDAADIANIRFDDGNLFTFSQQENIRNIFIMLRFQKPTGNFTADFDWQVWVEGGANVYAKYWVGGDGWHNLGSNLGGSAPPVITNDVTNKFGTNYLYVLIYGNVDSIPEDWIKCDIAKVNYSTATSIGTGE